MLHFEWLCSQTFDLDMVRRSCFLTRALVFWDGSTLREGEYDLTQMRAVFMQ